MLAGALDTSSDLYNPDFAQQLVDQIVSPAYTAGFDSNTASLQGDITQNGIINYADVAAFTGILTATFGEALGTISISQSGGTLPLPGIYLNPLPVPYPQLPTNAVDALNYITTAAFAPTIDEEDLIDPTTFST